MTMISKLAAGTAAAIALSLTPALADGYAKGKAAQHYSEPACANFGGFYVGIAGGSTTYNSHYTDRDSYAVINGAFSTSDSSSEDGLNIGGTIGYTRQTGCTIFGVEADWSWTDTDISRSLTVFGIPGTGVSVRDEVQSIGTLRTRAGVVVNNLMLYVTGGLAWAEIDHRITGNALNETFTTSGTRWGWTVGAGTEYAFTDRISLKSELLYVKLEDESNSFRSLTTQDFRFNHSDDIWITRIGLNFKLGSREAHYEPMK